MDWRFKNYIYYFSLLISKYDDMTHRRENVAGGGSTSHLDVGHTRHPSYPPLQTARGGPAEAN